MNMLKKILSVLFIYISVNTTIAQVLYSERFNSLSLTSGTFTSNSSTQTYYYNDVPAGMFTINNGNKIADTLSGNYPFYANGQKQKAWLSYVPSAISNTTDTFAVSTSWLNPSSSADAWLITPIINNISATTVLTWEAMAPDAINPDGYEVYVTTNTLTTPVTSDFSGNRIFNTLAEANTWQTHGISLAAYVGQNIRIAFRNNSSNKYQLWLDDIVVENINNSFDVATISNDVYKYSTPNINNYITATFKNNGYTTINNITINYRMGSGVTVTETQALSTALPYLASKQLTFSVPFISSSAAYYPLKIWVSAINGNADQLATNDTVTGSITLSTAIPIKKILLEEYTSAKCGWCPDAYTVMDSIQSTSTYSNVIAASTHTNDNMEHVDGNMLIADYTTELATATIDQYYFSAFKKMAIDRNNWRTFITQRQSMNVPATVAVTNYTYNSTTRQIDATVSATFVGDVKGDYRLNLYVKENHIYGPPGGSADNGWNQYSFLFNTPSSPYYQKGSYLNANTYLLNSYDYQHQYVIEHMAGGAYGNSGIIPATGPTAGQTFTMAYSYILPTVTTGEYRYNADNIHLIGLLTEYNTDPTKRTVINADEVKLTSNPEVAVGVKDLTASDFNLNLFPNPTTGTFNLNYTISESQNIKVSIYNTLGELVYIETLNTTAGNVNHQLNLEHLQQGNYSVVVSFKNNSISKKLTIIK